LRQTITLTVIPLKRIEKKRQYAKYLQHPGHNQRRSNYSRRELTRTSSDVIVGLYLGMTCKIGLNEGGSHRQSTGRTTVSGNRIVIDGEIG
jgi:hypothetical protein